jgi:hypothetical protein
MEKPKKVFRVGTITASIFVNKRKIEDRQIEIPSVSFQKRYKDEKGKWKTTNKLSINDLPSAIMVLTKAYEHIKLK